MGLVAPTSAAQQLDSVLAPGTTVAEVVSTSDSTQQYAVFAPAQFDPDSTWPVLFAMDPRGRALVPLRLLEPAAAEHGYIIISSHNTLSDGPPEPNIAAITALLADMQHVSSIDTSRLYLVGFSGTARIAWDVGFQLGDRVAGVVGFGAALPWPLSVLRAMLDQSGPPFVFFGGAGFLDFNYWELSLLNAQLDQLGMRHRIEFYDGPHAWPPEVQFTRAVEWLELQAIHSGLKTDESDWVPELLQKRTDEARAVRADKRLLDALTLYESIAEDFAGLQDVSLAAAAAEDLAQTQSVRQARQRLDQLYNAYLEYTGWLGEYLENVRTSEHPPTLSEAKERLWIDRLLRHAAGEDSLGGPGAQRMLETTFVHTAFYGPRAQFDSGRPDRALAMLEVAHAIKPTNGSTCYGLARARAQVGDPAGAVEALECVVAAWGTDPDRLERDPNLAPLVGSDEFDWLLRELREKQR